MNKIGALFVYNRTTINSGPTQRLQMANQAVPMADATPATAHLFIVNPLSGQTLMRLFSTHPPLEERIARLRAMRF